MELAGNRMSITERNGDKLIFLIILIFIKVVTLDGKEIATSGTMSGGGSPKSGLMGQQVRQAVI